MKEALNNIVTVDLQDWEGGRERERERVQRQSVVEMYIDGNRYIETGRQRNESKEELLKALCHVISADYLLMKLLGCML